MGCTCFCSRPSAVAPVPTCADLAPYQKAREIIEDRDRILTPNGVQENFKTRIGGVEQWFNVRGADRDNPIILFVHGGPASPLIPALWQFQRPIEEYFTVVNYDQRGAGKIYVEDHSEAVGDTLHPALHRRCNRSRRVHPAALRQEQADPDGTQLGHSRRHGSGAEATPICSTPTWASVR